MRRRRWSELSPRSRRLLLAGAGYEGVLKVAALADLIRRPAAEVRGPKAVWGAAIVVVNSAGAVPILYLLRGRRARRAA